VRKQSYEKLSNKPAALQDKKEI